jgi:hypothetical protein
VKTLLSLLLFFASSLTSCTTLANRRQLYAPQKPSGPYTEARFTGKLPSQAALDKEEKRKSAP